MTEQIKREPLKKLTKEEEKGTPGPVETSEIIKERIQEFKNTINPLSNFLTVEEKNIYFYFYSSEGINDNSWGCAWRSMQTCLAYCISKANKNDKLNEIGFENLFNKYGSKKCLLSIYNKIKNINESPSFLKEKLFAPHETQNGWAEPFISHLVLYDFNFKSKLILINSYNSHFYAPEETVCEKINFLQFKNMIIDNFSDENKKYPIIMDDSCVSLCVIGINENKNDKTIDLLIMDPHVSKDYTPDTGIYIVTLNENGEKIKETFPIGEIYGSRLVYFDNNKSWMALFPM